MKMIYKYVLKIDDEVSIIMPLDARILTIQCQGDDVIMWALVETNNPSVTRNFIIIGTGNPFPEGNFEYIGTVQMTTYVAVWHVFEK